MLTHTWRPKNILLDNTSVITLETMTGDPVVMSSEPVISGGNITVTVPAEGSYRVRVKTKNTTHAYRINVNDVANDPVTNFIPSSARGAANGVAPLGADSKLPDSRLPDTSNAAAVSGKVGKGDLVFNVSDYGATGDGTTDDRASIKAAVDAANINGGTVFIPPGEYFIGGYSTFASTGGSQFGRWAFTVRSNVSIVGAPGSVLTEDIDYNRRRVMFYLEGSDITIDGVSFRNDYDMSGGSRPTSIHIGAGDGFNAEFTGAIKNIRIQNCNFSRSWHPTKFHFSETSGTATVENVLITGCVARGEVTSPSSGGYNFMSSPPGKVVDVTVDSSKCYDVTVSAAIGYYGVQDGTITGNFCRGSLIDGAGIQLENGSDNVTITGNTMVNHYNGIWADDSTNVTISGNTIRNTTSHASFKGIRVTRQGYASDPNKLTTDIVASGNTLRNCYIAVESFGTPVGTPTFGSIHVSDNIVRLSGVTNSYGITMEGCIASHVTNNRVVGGALASIRLVPIANQFSVVTGNITTKASTESSVGLLISNSNAFRPQVSSNQFAQGLTVSQAVSARIGNALVFSNTGSPEGAVSAPVGSLFLREDGGAATSLYVKESGTGSTGWVAK